MTSDKQLNLIKNAQLAELAFTHLLPIIQLQKESILTKIKVLARNSTHDVVQYVGSLSAINALEDIENEIKKQIKAAQRIEQEHIKNGI